jgi:hypothetical protein
MTVEAGLKKAAEVTVAAQTIPVRGYVVNEEGGRLWLRDHEAMWLINTDDIVTKGDWAGVADPRLAGTPVLLFIRDGAEINELRRFLVRKSGQPITLKGLGHGTPLQVKGGTIVEAESPESASREIGFRPGSGITPLMRGERGTVCCYDSNWGMTCEEDDC